MESWHIINSFFYIICAVYLFKDILVTSQVTTESDKSEVVTDNSYLTYPFTTTKLDVTCQCLLRLDTNADAGGLSVTCARGQWELRKRLYSVRYSGPCVFQLPPVRKTVHRRNGMEESEAVRSGFVGNNRSP